MTDINTLKFQLQTALVAGQTQTRQRSCRGLGTFAALLIYVVLSLACFGRAVDWTKFYLGCSTDTLLFIWCLNWWPFALSHGLNPFITHYVWYPSGYNLTWSTSLATLAIIAWPITALGGPVLSYNILTLAAPALAGWTAFLLARELGCTWAAAFICGVLFGFSAPEVNQLAAELNLDSVYLAPLAVLLCVRRVRGKMRRFPFALALAFLLAAQMGISTEVLASLCVFGALSWAIVLFFAPAGERRAILRLAPDVACAAPLVMILAAPFLYYLARGLADFPSHIHPAIFQTYDLLLFALPVLPVHAVSVTAASVARQLHGFRLDDFSFASIPWLVILAWYFPRQLGRPYVRALLAAICMMAVLTLGLKFKFNGHVTSIPMPWVVFSHIPLIRSVLPLRFLIYFTLGAALATGLFLTAAKTPAARVSRYSLAALALLFLPPARVVVQQQAWDNQPVFAPQTTLKWMRWPEQPFFTTQHIRQVLVPSGQNKLPNVILLPDPVVGGGMAWQINAGMSFTQAEGYIGYILKPEQKWDISDSLTWNFTPGLGKLITAYCAAHRVDYVLIGPGTPPLLVDTIEDLGWAHHMDQGIEVVKIPAGLF